jgi:hypothetical protein
LNNEHWLKGIKMKKLIMIGLTLLASMSSFASLQNGDSGYMDCSGDTCDLNNFANGLLSSTSPLTYLVIDKEMNLNSTEGSARLIQEAYDLSSEPVATNALAKDLDVDAEEIRQLVKELFEDGNTVNVETITKNLK